MTLLVAFREKGKNYIAADRSIGNNHWLTGDRRHQYHDKKVFKGKEYYVACAGDCGVIDQCEIMAENRELADTKKGIYDFVKEIIKNVNTEFYRKDVNFGGIIITKDNIRNFNDSCGITKMNYDAVGSVDDVAKYILSQNKGKTLKKLKHLFGYYGEVIDGVSKEYDLVSI